MSDCMWNYPSTRDRDSSFQLSFTRSYSSTGKDLFQTRRDPLTPPSYNANERSPASKLWPDPKICCPWSISTRLSSTSFRIIFTHLQLRCSLDTRVKFDVFRNAYSDCDGKVYHKLRTTPLRGTGNLFPSCCHTINDPSLTFLAQFGYNVRKMLRCFSDSRVEFRLFI